MKIALLISCACLLGAAPFLRAEPPAQTAGNPALVPASKLENDFYDWNQRHEAILKIKKDLNPEIVMVGDSITHLWGGQPEEPKGNRGRAAWQELFGTRRVLNCGFGWDRTQNVLWRIEHGELDGLAPQLVVINIGTNNLAGTSHAWACTPEEIAAGIALIAQRCQEKCPQARVVVMGVFPRGRQAADANRAKVTAINAAAAKALAPVKGVTFLDIGGKFLATDGSIPADLMPDALHPSNAGYALWAAALKDVLPAPAKP